MEGMIEKMTKRLDGVGQALVMTTDRYLTSHMYDEDMTIELADGRR